METQQISPLTQMSSSDFKLFQKMIYSEAGINLTEKKITLLSNRIRKRLKNLNINSYQKYYQYLREADGREREIVSMINEVTTNVTHFFRNPKQFDKLKDSVIPNIINGCLIQRLGTVKSVCIKFFVVVVRYCFPDIC